MSKTNGRAKWEPIIQRFHESGKTAKQWAKEEGISYQSLVLWRRKLERLSSFIELDEPVRTFELRWRGVRIELSSFEELKELGKLLVHWC